jgi:hypothetical protein
MLKYKGFLIEPFETEPGRWRAEITRADHRKIKTFPDGQEHDFIRTGGAETFSAEAAIKVAMRLIDGGGMSWDPPKIRCHQRRAAWMRRETACWIAA